MSQLIPLFTDQDESLILLSPAENSSQQPSDLNILVTVSNIDGERTSYISNGRVVPAKSKHFVQTPPERMITEADRRKARISGGGANGGTVEDFGIYFQIQ